MGVEQLFRKIQVTASFLPDDMKRDDVEAEEEAKERAAKELKHARQQKSATGTTAKSTKDDEVDDEEDGIPDWDEVFESVVGEEVATLGEQPAQDDDDDSEDVQ